VVGDAATSLPDIVRVELGRLIPTLSPVGLSLEPRPTPGADARLHEHLLALLRALARSATVLLLVEDVHWADPSTRDFLLLTPAEKDKSPDIIADFKALSKASAQTTGASHPAILSLQRLSDAKESLAIRHQDDKDWWIVHVAGKTKSGDKTADQAVEVVLVGHAGE
jgi:hypothetical protein